MADTATGTTTDDTAATETTDTGGAAEKTFTQADIDRAVEARLARERKKYGDYDALKEKASKFDEAEQARLSDLEKAQQAAQKAAAERDALKAEVEQTRLESQIREAAREKGADPSLALDALRGSAKDLLDPSDMAGTMDKLLEARPALAVKQTTHESADQGARGTAAGQLTRADLQKMTPQEIDTAHAEGRLAHLLGS